MRKMKRIDDVSLRAVLITVGNGGREGRQIRNYTYLIKATSNSDLNSRVLYVIVLLMLILLYYLLNRAHLVHNLFLVYLFLSIFINSVMQEHMLPHTRQSSTQNNKYQASHKHSCFSCYAGAYAPAYQTVTHTE